MEVQILMLMIVVLIIWKKIDIEGKNGKTLDLPMGESYSHAGDLTHRYWREKDATDCLKLSMSSYLYHFLLIADDASVLTI